MADDELVGDDQPTDQDRRISGKPSAEFPEPTKRLVVRDQPVNGMTQTRLFGDFEEKEGEVDVILKPL
ncbi:MAG: hypothetical protein IT379_12795 [Deltaproteobacteria bacterium]|nr:hypothetical protein [Deltaproteobacteria bacterium]